MSPLVLFLVLFLLSWAMPAMQQRAFANEDDMPTNTADSEKVNNVPRVHLLPEAMEQAALADESIKKQTVWLDSPEGKDRGNVKFLGLEMLEQASEPQGAILLLHGVDQHPDWPQVIKPLRTALPEGGWYTFSIMLPYEGYEKQPARELGAKTAETVEVTDGMPLFSGRYSALNPLEEPSGETGDIEGEAIEGEPTETAADLALADSEANKDEGKEKGEDVIDVSSAGSKKSKSKALNFDDKVSFRLASAFEYIAQRGHQNIVLIGYQQGAESVFNYLADNKVMLPEKGLTIIWVDALFSDRAQNRMGELLEKDSPLLILDIVDTTSGLTSNVAKRRVSDAKRQNYTGYSQIRLPVSPSASLMKSGLTQRIKGWLKVNAEGMSAKRLIK
jgi:hypothetical protein